MDELRDQPTSGQVIVGAGVAAAILAGIALVLGRRREENSAADRARAASHRLGETIPDLASVLEERTAEAAREGRRRFGRLTDGERREVARRAAETALDELTALRRQAGEVIERGGERGRDASKRFGEQARVVGAETTSAAQAIAAQAAAAAVARAERALGLGASVADAAKERVPLVRQRVGEDVVPPLRDVATQAAATALDLWQAARERAAEASHADLGQSATQAAHLAAAGGERARGATVLAVGRAADLARDASRRVSEATVDRAREATARTAERTVDRAKEASRRTAGATVDAGKDTGAVLFWAGAAAGLVFYALLSPERRDQVSRAMQEAVAQVRELVRDFQGYDDEF